MHENKIIQFDDLAVVLHSAHMRRSADFGHWLRQYFKGRRQAKLQEANENLLNTTISLAGSSHQ
jgi:hypothetical protein